MAKGDWAIGSTIQFDSKEGPQITLNADGTVSVGIRWWVVLPSGPRVWPPVATFTVTVTPPLTPTAVTTAIVTGLSAQEGVAVVPA
jgi:hypothetical protein